MTDNSSSKTHLDLLREIRTKLGEIAPADFKASAATKEKLVESAYYIADNAIIEAEKSPVETKASIVGWMVGEPTSNPAMYNLAQYQEASDAARRWNRPITALIICADSPSFAPWPAVETSEAGWLGCQNPNPGGGYCPDCGHVHATVDCSTVKASEPNYNVPPWHLSKRVPGCHCDGCSALNGLGEQK